MYKKVFVEKRVIETRAFEKLQKKLRVENYILIDRIDQYFGRVKKPYLFKNKELNLYIGFKDGELVKEAPDAYGLGEEKHFYYIHAKNCIYECQYCYLQGYFNSPDLVLYLNHQDVMDKMEKLILKYPGSWFHAGEFSDSLALSHLTGEISAYYPFFQKHKDAKLELRTKSVQTKELLSLKPLENIYVSFSLSSHQNAKDYDLKCPSIKHRLLAIKKLYQAGYKIAIHLDPMVYTESFSKDYSELIKDIKNVIPLNEIQYISLGVVRYTKDVYREVQKNYPRSRISHGNYSTSFDGKVRYNKPMRYWMMNSVKQELLNQGARPKSIYLCMESSS